MLNSEIKITLFSRYEKYHNKLWSLLWLIIYLLRNKSMAKRQYIVLELIKSVPNGRSSHIDRRKTRARI